MYAPLCLHWTLRKADALCWSPVSPVTTQVYSPRSPMAADFITSVPSRPIEALLLRSFIINQKHIIKHININILWNSEYNRNQKLVPVFLGSVLLHETSIRLYLLPSRHSRMRPFRLPWQFYWQVVSQVECHLQQSSETATHLGWTI